MPAKIWRPLRRPDPEEEVRADEEMVSRELQASAPAPELEQLAAARGATLVHMQGAFIEGDPALADLPGAPIPGLEMIGAAFEFNERPLLCLTGPGHGEGLCPCEPQDIFWEEGSERRDLDEVEPFAGVVGTRFRELTLLSHRGHPFHVGIRLKFEGAELVFLNLADKIEVYDGLVPEVLQPQNEPGRLYDHVYEYPFVGES